MNRRRVLVSISGLVVLTGCLETSGTEEPTSASPSNGPQSKTTSKEGTGTERSTPANNEPDQTSGSSTESGFEIVEIDYPENVDPREWWTWSLTIRNVNSEAKVFNCEIENFVSGEGWRAENSFQFTIPGETERTFESPESRIVSGAIRYRLTHFDKEFEVRLSEEELPFGRTFETPTGLAVTVSDVSLMEEISYEDSEGETQTYEPDEGKLFGTTTVSVKNTSNSVRQAPQSGRFTAWDIEPDRAPISGDPGRTRPQWTVAIDDYYEGGEIDPDATLSGEVGFEIDDSVSSDDLTVPFRGEGFAVQWGESPPFDVYYEPPARRTSP